MTEATKQRMGCKKTEYTCMQAYEDGLRYAYFTHGDTECEACSGSSCKLFQDSVGVDLVPELIFEGLGDDALVRFRCESPLRELGRTHYTLYVQIPHRSRSGKSQNEAWSAPTSDRLQ